MGHVVVLTFNIDCCKRDNGEVEDINEVTYDDTVSRRS